MARKSSTSSVTGALVDALEMYASSAAEPDRCSAPALSDAVTVHVLGSVAVDNHARAEILVGFVPVTRLRTRSVAPVDQFGIVTSGVSNVSAPRFDARARAWCWWS